MTFTTVPTVVDGDDFTDDFTLAVKAAIDELQLASRVTVPRATNIGGEVIAARIPVSDATFEFLIHGGLTNNTGAAITTTATLATIPDGYRPTAQWTAVGVNTNTGAVLGLVIDPTGVIRLGAAWTTPGIPAGHTVTFSHVAR